MRIPFMFILSLFLQACSDSRNKNTSLQKQAESVTKTLQADTLPERNTPKEAVRYRFDTTLKGGYTLVYKVDDTAQHLYLKKDTIIGEIANEETWMNQSEFGLMYADFKNSFILADHSGSGNNPAYVELIEKKTGKIILPISGKGLIDADEKSELFLYADDVPDKGDSLTLYDVRSGRKELYKLPDDIFNGPDLLHRIRIKKISRNKLVIKYYLYGKADHELTKNYNR